MLSTLYVYIHAGNDYLVDTQNTSSKVFTVVFQSKQANSTEHVILLSDDQIFEGREYFRLRIIGIRFIGQASIFFRPQDGLTNIFADVSIEDNDSTFRTLAAFHLSILEIEEVIACLKVACTFPLLAIVVYINWTISEAIQVTEGQGVEVTLSGEAVGVYANPIAIGVVCAETIATDVEPGTSASIACFAGLIAMTDLHACIYYHMLLLFVCI